MWHLVDRKLWGSRGRVDEEVEEAYDVGVENFRVE
jgi:hypothetical protein